MSTVPTIAADPAAQAPVAGILPDVGPVCLLIDDSRFDRRQIRTAIERADVPMRIREAKSLGEARSILTETEVDLILLDNNLPDGTGLAYAKELASDDHLNRIPVVMISGDDAEPLSARAIEAGCSAFVTKDELSARKLGQLARSMVARSSASVPEPEDMEEIMLGVLKEFIGEFVDQLKSPLIRSMRIIAGARDNIRAGDRERALGDLEQLHETVLAMQIFIEDARRLDRER